MIFEWFVFFGIIAGIFLLWGFTRHAFMPLFVGSILLMILGASVFAEGIQTETGATITDINSDTKQITFVTTTQNNTNNIFLYGLGMLFAMFGLGGALISVGEFATFNKKESSWNGKRGN